MKANQNPRIPNSLVVSNLGARHGRTDRPHLIEKEELANFSKDPIYSKCGKLYIPDESKEASDSSVE